MERADQAYSAAMLGVWSVMEPTPACAVVPWIDPPWIDLGTAVCVSLSGSLAARDLVEEGVVIEVVPPWRPIRSARVVRSRSAGSGRSSVRYVVQCWACRVVRNEGEMEVVCW